MYGLQWVEFGGIYSILLIPLAKGVVLKVFFENLLVLCALVNWTMTQTNERKGNQVGMMSVKLTVTNKAVLQTKYC